MHLVLKNTSFHVRSTQLVVKVVYLFLQAACLYEALQEWRASSETTGLRIMPNSKCIGFILLVFSI